MNGEGSTAVREAERSGGLGPQAPVLPSGGANAVRARASHPKRPTRRLGHISGLIGCLDGSLDEISGRLLDQICRVIYLVEKLNDEIVNLHKPFLAPKFGAFLVSNDQFCKLHGDDGSPMHGGVPANRLSETLFSRDRHVAGSHTQMAYSMPSWTPVRLRFAGQGLCEMASLWWRASKACSIATPCLSAAEQSLACLAEAVERPCGTAPADRGSQGEGSQLFAEIYSPSRR